MNSQTNLEIAGTLGEHSLPELLFEISNAQLNGSLRLSNSATEQKVVVYFDAGDAVFAASNARRFRLYEMLVRENTFSKQQMATLPAAANDLALGEFLAANGIYTKAEINALLTKQIALILKDAFAWSEAGDWIFSPFVRVKGDIRFNVDAPALLVEHARNLSDDAIAAKFKNFNESFAVSRETRAPVDLLPEEAFVFSRFEDSRLDLEQVLMLSGLPATATMRIVYTLRLGGFLTSAGRKTPFSARTLDAIRSANLSLKKPEATAVKVAAPKDALPPAADDKKNDVSNRKAPLNQEPQTPALTLEEYLERVETAANYYDIFEIAADAPVADVKRAYFSLAKRFHPDLFQREVAADKHRQIQNAFTRIAHAYDALKNEQTREVYDYKMRKESAQAKIVQTSAPVSSEEINLQKIIERAADDFENGFSFLMDENFDEAVPFLARAAHLVPNNARYRAYYGKALSATDFRQKHKAEAEMQAALKLDPNNADFRLLLAEFFVQMNLPKRAEGELNRLLSIFPSNKGARILLDSLEKR